MSTATSTGTWRWFLLNHSSNSAPTFLCNSSTYALLFGFVKWSAAFSVPSRSSHVADLAQASAVALSFGGSTVCPKPNLYLPGQVLGLPPGASPQRTPSSRGAIPPWRITRRATIELEPHRNPTCGPYQSVRLARWRLSPFVGLCNPLVFSTSFATASTLNDALASTWCCEGHVTAQSRSLPGPFRRPWRCSTAQNRRYQFPRWLVLMALWGQGYVMAATYGPSQLLHRTRIDMFRRRPGSWPTDVETGAPAGRASHSERLLLQMSASILSGQQATCFWPRKRPSCCKQESPADAHPSWACLWGVCRLPHRYQAQPWNDPLLFQRCFTAHRIGLHRASKYFVVKLCEESIGAHWGLHRCSSVCLVAIREKQESPDSAPAPRCHGAGVIRRIASNQRSALPDMRHTWDNAVAQGGRPPSVHRSWILKPKTWAQSGAVSEANLRCDVHAARVKTSVHLEGNLDWNLDWKLCSGHLEPERLQEAIPHLEYLENWHEIKFSLRRVPDTACAHFFCVDFCFASFCQPESNHKSICVLTTASHAQSKNQCKLVLYISLRGYVETSSHKKDTYHWSKTITYFNSSCDFQKTNTKAG